MTIGTYMKSTKLFTMTKRRRTLLILLAILIIAVVAFIWGNSLDSNEVSAAKSERVLEWVRPLLEVFAGLSNVTEHLVRKLAHFFEYSVLGSLLAAWIFIRHGQIMKCWLIGPAFGLAVAAVDETIQLFSDGRGAAIMDVLLDFSGVCFGIGAVSILIWVARFFRRR